MDSSSSSRSRSHFGGATSRQQQHHHQQQQQQQQQQHHHHGSIKERSFRQIPEASNYRGATGAEVSAFRFSSGGDQNRSKRRTRSSSTASRYESVGTGKLRLVPESPGWYRKAPAGTGKPRLVPEKTCLYRKALERIARCNVIHRKAYLSKTKVKFAWVALPHIIGWVRAVIFSHLSITHVYPEQ